MARLSCIFNSGDIQIVMAFHDILFHSLRRPIRTFLDAWALRQVFVAVGIVLTGCGVEVVKPQPNRHRKSAEEPHSRSANTLAQGSSVVPKSGQKSTADVTLATAVPPRGTPKLVAGETTHDFGTMNPVTNNRHTFVVRNEGTADLRLLDHRSSCDCTVGRFSTAPIPPGGSAEVLVQWHTPANQRMFRQTATVETNDPNCPSLAFTIVGKVRVHMGAEPAELVASDVRPDESRTLSTILTSQVWEGMKIQSIEASLPELKWQLNPATPDQLAASGAVAGYELQVTLPPTLSVGPFRHWVRLHVQRSAEDPSTEAYEIPLHGKVLRRLAVYGPGIDLTGTVDLGIVASSQGRTHRLMLKVYDTDTHLSLKTVHCEPSFLEARIQPATAEQAARGIYYLELLVPPDAPDCRYLREKPGRLRLEFDHPRIEPLELNLVFSVARDHLSHRPRGESADGLVMRSVSATLMALGDNAN